MSLTRQDRKVLTSIKNGIKSDRSIEQHLLNTFIKSGYVFVHEGLVFITPSGEKIVSR